MERQMLHSLMPASPSQRVYYHTAYSPTLLILSAVSVMRLGALFHSPSTTPRVWQIPLWQRHNIGANLPRAYLYSGAVLSFTYTHKPNTHTQAPPHSCTHYFSGQNNYLSILFPKYYCLCKNVKDTPRGGKCWLWLVYGFTVYSGYHQHTHGE